LLTWFASFSTLHAQQGRKIGIKGGLNIASIYNTDADLERLTTFSAGVFYDIGLPLAGFSLRPEANISQKGGEEDYLVDGQPFTNTIVSSHLEFPILLKWSLSVPGPVKPNLLAGPYLGFLLNSDIRVKNARGSTLISEGLEDQTNTTAFGAVGAVGADIFWGRTLLVVEARYSLGLSNAFKEEVGNPLLRDARNRVLTLSFGIKI